MDGKSSRDIKDLTKSIDSNEIAIATNHSNYGSLQRMANIQLQIRTLATVPNDFAQLYTGGFLKFQIQSSRLMLSQTWISIFSARYIYMLTYKND